MLVAVAVASLLLQPAATAAQAAAEMLAKHLDQLVVTERPIQVAALAAEHQVGSTLIMQAATAAPVS
jgi:hypothetical protein